MTDISSVGSYNTKQTQRLDELNKVNTNNTKVSSDNEFEDFNVAEFTTEDESSYVVETDNPKKLTDIDSKINELTKEKEKLESKINDHLYAFFHRSEVNQLKVKVEDIDKQIKKYEKMKADASVSEDHIKALESRKAKLEILRKNQSSGFNDYADKELQKINDELNAYKN